MEPRVYYNDNSPEAVQGLQLLMAERIIPRGVIDPRSIKDIHPNDLKGFDHCHFFAGYGGWPLALMMAGWPAEREVWSGSCPCQPYSSAGLQKGEKDERDLWPYWDELIAARRPATIFGEQVERAILHGWIDRVSANMATKAYQTGIAVLPACGVDAPHKRDRIAFVSDDGRMADGAGEDAGRRSGKEQRAARGQEVDDRWMFESAGADGGLGDRNGAGSKRKRLLEKRAHRKEDFETWWSSEDGDVGDGIASRSQRHARDDRRAQGREDAARPASETSFWHTDQWVICADGKARRIPSSESGICLVVDGIPSRLVEMYLRGMGNAIVPEVFARFIRAYMSARGIRAQEGAIFP